MVNLLDVLIFLNVDLLKSNHYLENDRSLTEEQKQNIIANINTRKNNILQYKDTLNVLHHIRNAYAHGLVSINSDEICITDKDKSGNITYANVVSINTFRELMSKNNLSIVFKFLVDKNNPMRNKQVA